MELTIFNAMGPVVAKPVSKVVNNGQHTILVDMSTYSSGVYYYQMTLNGVQ